MLTDQDKIALTTPVKRVFFKSDQKTALTLTTAWQATQVPLDVKIGSVLTQYQADYITYHHCTASGLAYEAMPATTPGWVCEKSTLGDKPIWIVTADIRFEQGKALRDALTAINALRKQAPDFSPYCLIQLGLAACVTLSREPQTGRIEQHYPFVGEGGDPACLVLSFPTGGSEQYAPPALDRGWHAISEEQYLAYVLPAANAS